MSAYRSGFAAILGRPNVGKSTLLNQLVGEKLAIVSDKPQTTRNRVLGVIHKQDGQAVLLDTPGWQRPLHRLGEFMLETSRAAARDVDAIILVVDATSRPGSGDSHIVREVMKTGHPPVLLVVNKADLVPDKMLMRLKEYFEIGDFHGAFPTSALTGEGVPALEKELFSLLPPGPPYFPSDMSTDQPERILIAEFIRERALNLLREEVPHSVAVLVEEVSARPQNRVYVRALIYVERKSQKGIIIGRGGSMLRDIGRGARTEIERILGSGTYLDLHVKVVPKWRDRMSSLRELGYSPEKE